MPADPYNSLLDFLADLLVEDLAAEARADFSEPETAKGAMPGTARPSHSQQHHQERREDTAPTKLSATSA
jgi:hypothetical protein